MDEWRWPDAFLLTDTGPTGDADGYAKTAQVGSFPPNGYGLYDMAGNVWEWCSDLYVPEQDSTPPLGWVGDTEHRILRGGGWLIASYMSDDRYVLDLRVDFRMTYNAEVQDQNIGCRCVADASTSPPVSMP